MSGDQFRPSTAYNRWTSRAYLWSDVQDVDARHEFSEEAVQFSSFDVAIGFRTAIKYKGNNK